MIKAITRIDPKAQVTVSDNDFSEIVWHDGNPNNITLEQVQRAEVEMQSEYDAQEYARNRATAYASTGDQLDMQYWDSVNDTTTWKDHVASVKDQFPKV
jgi:hypothetical protein